MIFSSLNRLFRIASSPMIWAGSSHYHRTSFRGAGQYLGALQSQLKDAGVTTKVFRSTLYHHWFMCMWTSRRRKKLQRVAKRYDAVIVLGCESATETVRAVVPSHVKVIEGMETAGIMNGKLSFRWPGSLLFEDCRVVQMSRQRVA